MNRLVVDNVGKEYPTRGEPLRILRGVSFEMEERENLAILGPSGSGKSTLLSILGALDRPTSGRVMLADEDPFELDEPELARFRNRKVGFVFQDHHLAPQCSVLENVLIPTLADGVPTDAEVARASELIERVGLTSRIAHPPAELSGGEKQRVAIARALIRGPQLLLADEPTGNLDRSTACSIGALMLEMQQDAGTILVVVTHSEDLANVLTRRMELDDGALREVAKS